jgi:ATP-dependent DNA ligase
MSQRTLPGRVHRAVPPNQNSSLPSSREWLHEIKPDGFRVIARKEQRGPNAQNSVGANSVS